MADTNISSLPSSLYSQSTTHNKHLSTTKMLYIIITNCERFAANLHSLLASIVPVQHSYLHLHEFRHYAGYLPNII
jgi:hypothetical protein